MMLTFPLSVRDPEPEFGKHYMIQFSTDEHASRDVDMPWIQHVETWAYNRACEEIMKAHDLSPFHQIGQENEPGYHGWEIWGQATKAEMESLVPEIEKKAQENMKLLKETT